MRARRLTPALTHGVRALGLLLLGAILVALALADEAPVVDESILRIDTAEATAAGDARSQTITLPDDWAVSRPRFDGDVRYRMRFDRPAVTPTDGLLALYIERVCSNLEIDLNQRRIFSGGRMTEPVAMNCRHPQLITLPAALLEAQGNVLDIRVTGNALQHVASREFAGGLSALQIGPRETLAVDHARRTFWNVTWLQLTAMMLAVGGVLMLVLTAYNPREVYFGYFGGLCLAWAFLSLRLWVPYLPWGHVVTEYLFCIGLASLVMMSVQFLLSYAGLRSRAIETVLVVQWFLVPLTLIVGGETRLFAVATIWYVLFCAELLVAAGLYLAFTRRERNHDYWPMAGVLGASSLLVLIELGAQHDLYPWLQQVLPWPTLSFLLPLPFLIVGVRLFLLFARALRTAEHGRAALARRVRELTTEFEGNFSQLAELRVEQVTEKERKRIAADLHDDLGAKLLTIVHTSESQRISALAREALEDMRLSVKGLIGKPMRLADALADWRAETVARLSQSKVEVDWLSPIEETEHLLPSRGFVQTTRIVRESVSNIIKHSGATRCSVRCRIADGYFAMTIQDNGRGIPMELDGKLDGGLGMSNMKRRAKQMRGQCLVQSGPGYGTVIALTVPL
jgi:two-component system, NarL family, sensor histidine kinase UhpB